MATKTAISMSYCDILLVFISVWAAAFAALACLHKKFHDGIFLKIALWSVVFSSLAVINNPTHASAVWFFSSISAAGVAAATRVAVGKMIGAQVKFINRHCGHDA